MFAWYYIVIVCITDKRTLVNTHNHCSRFRGNNFEITFCSFSARRDANNIKTPGPQNGAVGRRCDTIRYVNNDNEIIINYSVSRPTEPDKVAESTVRYRQSRSSYVY